MKIRIHCPVCHHDFEEERYGTPTRFEERCPRCQSLLESNDGEVFQAMDEKAWKTKKRLQTFVPVGLIVIILALVQFDRYQNHRERERARILLQEQQKLDRIAALEEQERKTEETRRKEQEKRAEAIRREQDKQQRVIKAREWQSQALRNFAITDVEVDTDMNLIAVVLKPEKMSTKENAKQIASMIARSYCHQVGVDLAVCQIISPYNGRLFATGDYYR